MYILWSHAKFLSAVLASASRRGRQCIQPPTSMSTHSNNHNDVKFLVGVASKEPICMSIGKKLRIVKGNAVDVTQKLFEQTDQALRAINLDNDVKLFNNM